MRYINTDTWEDVMDYLTEDPDGFLDLEDGVSYCDDQLDEINFLDEETY